MFEPVQVVNIRHPWTIPAPLLRLPAAMVAALPCQTGVCKIHAAIGFAVVGVWFLFFAWGAAAFAVRREPNPWFWRLLAVLQVGLGVQLIAGLILLALGRRADSWLHYLYGVVFPVIVLAVTHVVARGLEDEEESWKWFTGASFIIFGLTLRALTTGLGLP